MTRTMTTTQNADTIIFGSAKFEVGETEETLVDLGAMNGVTFEESWEKVTVRADNVGVIKEFLKNHTAKLAGDLVEINLETLAMLRGGIDKLTEIPAVEGEGEAAKKAAIQLLSGGFSEFKPRVVRVTNYNEKDEEFRITVFKATTETGITINFPSEDDDDPAATPIEMVGFVDTSKVLGEQLFEIYSEQGAVPTP
ncbi:hypothetical protein [Sporosarcina sp. FSL K6-3457]|uniref:hypothetical protein n=1 Tax=Sporosarcina sp. FSL K6-3457 TaxID=2978204 RepID=UPI0030F8A830